MLQNLSKLKKLQQQQAQEAQVKQQLQPFMNVLMNQIPKNIGQVEEEIRNIHAECSASIVLSYDKEEQEMAKNIQKSCIQNINSLSAYNYPFFIKYFGVKFVQHNHKQKANNQQNIRDHKSKQLLPDQDKKSLEKDDKKDSQNKADKKQKSKQQQNKIKDKQIQKKISLKIYTERNIQKIDWNKLKVESKNKKQFAEKIELIISLSQALALVHQLQYTFFNQNIQDFLYSKNGKFKLAIHALRLRRTIGEQQLSKIKMKNKNKIKKDALVKRSVKYNCPEFLFQKMSLKDVRKNDVWKLGIQVFTILIGQDLSPELIALESLEEEKMKDYKIFDEKKLLILNKYIKQKHLSQLLKMLSLSPAERIQIKAIIPILKSIYGQINESFSMELLEASKSKYLKEQEQVSYKFMPVISANEEIFSTEHKKKIGEYFKNHQTRPIKDYKLLYRASQSKFSCKTFYQVVFQRRNLLIIFSIGKEKKKIIAYCEEAFDLNKCNGIFGGYIKDSKKMSFIYSPQENQFFKLKNADRALGVSHIQGPIIGDGDLIIGDGGSYNVSRFPASFESGRIKKLLKTDKFDLQEYDVYQILF